jgi:hypothetical protein
MRFEVRQSLSREGLGRISRSSYACDEFEQYGVFVCATPTGKLGVLERHPVLAEGMPIRVENGAVITECRSRKVRDH